MLKSKGDNTLPCGTPVKEISNLFSSNTPALSMVLIKFKSLSSWIVLEINSRSLLWSIESYAPFMSPSIA